MAVVLKPEISALDQLTIEAAVLVPVLRALRAELGEERANELVLTALRNRRRDALHQIAAQVPGSPKQKWQGLYGAFQARLGTDVDYELVDGEDVEEVEPERIFEMLTEDRESIDFNVTGCRFADFFRAIGEPELGAVLVCEGDHHAAEIGIPEVELTITQTRMMGADCCDFRFRFETDAG